MKEQYLTFSMPHIVVEEEEPRRLQHRPISDILTRSREHVVKWLSQRGNSLSCHSNLEPWLNKLETFEVVPMYTGIDIENERTEHGFYGREDHREACPISFEKNERSDLAPLSPLLSNDEGMNFAVKQLLWSNMFGVASSYVLFPEIAVLIWSSQHA